MRKLLFIFSIGVIQTILSGISASIPQSSADSLLSLLKGNPDTKEKSYIYVHLADLYADSTETAAIYWNQALTEAIKTKDQYITKLSLDMLLKQYAGKDSSKVKEYLSIAKQNLPEKHNTLFRSYMYCYDILAKIRKNNSSEIISQELRKLKQESQASMTPEKQIQWEFLTGVSLDYSSIMTHTYKEIPNAIPYMQRALDLLASFPLKDRIHFEELCHIELSDLYMYTRDKRAVDERKSLLELYILWDNMATDFKRIFQDDTAHYMNVYSSILYLTDILSKKEAEEYYQKYLQLARQKNCMDHTYDTSARYYQTIGDNKKAILYIDSTLQKEIYSPLNLIAIYDIKASLYNNISDYKNAYKTLKESNELRKSMNSETVHKQMVEMQTRFDVDKLQLEKIKLADKNKLFALVGIFILLLVFICWGMYQLIMVKRLQNMHIQMTAATEEAKKQSIKATESEKMKSAFLNSICHEVRTPLNSINGFSQILFDDSLDTSTRQECQQQIESNTIALTFLLDNMLELSQLVCSDALLPVQEINIDALCNREMEKLKKESEKPDIEYQIDGNRHECDIQTNGFYLARVMNNLLNNANKFTNHGIIRLSYHIDKEKRKVILSVSDTGIGIPADKQEWVFERFTKMDDFKPGTGLGLYVCRIIIQRLGGTINIDSSYTAGCRVIVTLPL